MNELVYDRAEHGRAQSEGTPYEGAGHERVPLLAPGHSHSGRTRRRVAWRCCCCLPPCRQPTPLALDDLQAVAPRLSCAATSYSKIPALAAAAADQPGQFTLAAGEGLLWLLRTPIAQDLRISSQHGVRGVTNPAPGKLCHVNGLQPREPPVPGGAGGLYEA